MAEEFINYLNTLKEFYVIDQWNRIETPEMDSQLFGEIIFDKSGKNIQWTNFLTLIYLSWPTGF